MAITKSTLPGPSSSRIQTTEGTSPQPASEVERSLPRPAASDADLAQAPTARAVPLIPPMAATLSAGLSAPGGPGALRAPRIMPRETNDFPALGAHAYSVLIRVAGQDGWSADRLTQISVLPGDVQGRLVAALELTTSRELHEMVLERVFSEGFASLPASAQDAVLWSIVEGADDALSVDVADFASLAGDSTFAALSPAVRAIVEQQFAKHGQDIEARRALRRIFSAPLDVLSEPEKQRLARLVGGQNAEVSKEARSVIDAYLRGPEFDNGDFASMAQRLADFVRAYPSTSGRTIATSADYLGRRAPYTLESKGGIAEHPFTSGTAAALAYDVVVGSDRVRIYVPESAPAASGSYVHSADDVASAVATLPPILRRRLTSINVSPGRNPLDAHFQQVFNDPNHRAYMNAGTDGVVNTFPTQFPQTRDSLAGALTHEVGHVLSFQLWYLLQGNVVGSWDEWDAARQSDGLVCSGYAKMDRHEDFAETFMLYFQVMGTAREGELRALFPARFAIIDRMIAAEGSLASGAPAAATSSASSSGASSGASAGGAQSGYIGGGP